MLGPRPLFGSGLARSGGRLVGSMLSVNKAVMVAVCPYLELFRSLRNAIVRAFPHAELERSLDPASPFQDYYFADERVAVMDAVLAGDLEVRFDPTEWDRLLERSAARAELECAELVPYLPRMLGPTYRHMFDNALGIIAEARHAASRRWLGMYEPWAVELFPSLARAYPEARFYLLLRDPRAIVSSMLAMQQRDPSQGAHTLSYARHWRKYAAFAAHLRRDPLFAGRLHVLTHEQVVREPEVTARQFCDFLQVAYDPAMLDTRSYVDYATGSVWAGNSSFETATAGISPHRAQRWRAQLEPAVLELVELVCGPEMRLFGYEPVAYAGDGWPASDVLSYMIRDNAGPCSWRSDFGDPQVDYGFELFRRALLAADGRLLDRQLIRRCFLFEDVYAELRQPVGEASLV